PIRWSYVGSGLPHSFTAHREGPCSGNHRRRFGSSVFRLPHSMTAQSAPALRTSPARAGPTCTVLAAAPCRPLRLEIGTRNDSFSLVRGRPPGLGPGDRKSVV